MDKRKKVYYPDAQIQKGLYTNGKEYMFTNGIEYQYEAKYDGYFLRYFVKRHFNDIVTEVTKDVYSTLTDKFYQKVEVRWKLVDNAAMVNRKQIQLANESVIGLSNYITNYTEFLKS